MSQEHTETGSFTRLLQGLAIGAAAMYLLDPDKGRRRRALVRDRLNRVGCDIADLAHDAARDSANRLQGVRARVDRRGRDNGAVDELRLIERVRSALGRVVSHPHAIQVGAMQGTIRLSGPVLAHELPAVLATARSVAGVTGVDSQLDVHAQPDVPALQGAGRVRRGNDYPAPAARMATLLGGGFLALYALRKDGLARLATVAMAYALGRRALYGTPGSGSDRASHRRADSDRQLPMVIHAGRPVRSNGAAATGASPEGAEQAQEPSRAAPPATH